MLVHSFDTSHRVKCHAVSNTKLQVLDVEGGAVAGVTDVCCCIYYQLHVGRQLMTTSVQYMRSCQKETSKRISRTCDTKPGLTESGMGSLPSSYTKNTNMPTLRVGLKWRTQTVTYANKAMILVGQNTWASISTLATA